MVTVRLISRRRAQNVSVSRTRVNGTGAIGYEPRLPPAAERPTAREAIMATSVMRLSHGRRRGGAMGRTIPSPGLRQRAGVQRHLVVAVLVPGQRPLALGERAALHLDAQVLPGR